MSLQVRCPNPECGKLFAVADELIGKTARCKGCAKPFALKPTQATKGARETHAGPTSTKSPAKNGQVDTLGRFQVRQRLGAGAFGTVYRAFDPQLERDIALKVPQQGIMDSPKRVERFLREAKAAAQLRHPNIVPVFEAGQDQDQYFIASAFIAGQPLAAAVGETGIDCQRAARIVHKLAEALAYAHGLGIVHRDIKPANVMLDPEDQPLLMDFGLAARTDSTEKLTQDGAVLGTPAYMAPEQAAGQKGEAQPASDQYSLGVVLYELLTGKTPFEGPPQVVLFNVLNQEPPTPRTLRKDIPRDLETICLKAMAKKTEHRYVDCQALADDLRRWQEGEPITARRPGFGERVVRWCKREPKLAASGALALVGVIALAVGLFILNEKLQADYGDEVAGHGKTKKTLEDEIKDHRSTKGDLYVKQVGLAKQQIDNGERMEGLKTLELCSPNFRNWEWRHLSLAADGGVPAVRMLSLPPTEKEEWNKHVSHMTFTADSQLLLASYSNGLKATWDPGQGTIVKSKKGPSLNRAAFSSDGQWMAMLVEGKIEEPPVNPVTATAALGLLAEGPLQASSMLGTLDRYQYFRPRLDVDWFVPSPNQITLVDTATGRTLKDFKVLGGVMHSLGLSADGKMLAAAASTLYDRPAKVVIYNTETGEELSKVEETIDFVNGLLFSPDGKWLVVSTSGVRTCTIKKPVYETIEEVVDGKKIQKVVVRYVHECKQVSSKSPGKVVDVAAKKIAYALPSPGKVAFRSDSKLMVLAGEDGIVTLNAATGGMVRAFRGPARLVGALAFSPDGSRLATAPTFDQCNREPHLHLWDVELGRFVVALRGFDDHSEYGKLVFSPDGRYLAAALEHNATITLWSTGAGRLLYPYDDHRGPVNQVVWSSDGQLLASHSECNQTSRVWKAETGKTLLMASEMFGRDGLIFGSGNRFLFPGAGCLGLPPGGAGCYGMVNYRPGLRLWDRKDLKEVALPKSIDKVLAVHPDGSRWVVMPVTGPLSGPLTLEQLPAAKMWDPDKGAAMFSFPGVREGHAVDFTDDGARLVASGAEMMPIEVIVCYPTTVYKEIEVDADKDGEKVKLKKKVPTTELHTKVETRMILANQVKVFSTVDGTELFKVNGVGQLFAVSGDGKRLATLPPPPEPQPVISAPKAMPPPPPPQPKKAPTPIPKENTEVEVAFQDGKIQPAPKKIGKNEDGEPEEQGPMMMPPAPPPIITLWSVDTGKTTIQLKDFPMQPADLRFTPDGKFILAWTPGGTDIMWEERVKDVGGKKEVYKVKVPKQVPASLMVWETATGKRVVQHVGASGLCLFSPDGTRLASASGPPVLGQASGPGGMPPFGVPAPAPAPSPKSARTPHQPGGFDVFKVNLASAAQAPIPLPPYAFPTYQPMAPSAVHVFDLTSGRDLFSFRDGVGPVSALSWSSDGNLLASAHYGHASFVQGAPVMTADAPGVHDDGLEYASHRYGRYGHGGHGVAEIMVWNLGKGQKDMSILGHAARVNCLAFDPEGKRLASASDDATVKVWRVEANLSPAPPSKDKVVQAPVTPDPTPSLPTPVVEATIGTARLQGMHCANCIGFVANRLLLTPGTDDGFFVWEIPSGNLQRVVKAGAGSFAVSGDGTRCATASYDGVLALWDTSDWKMLNSWKSGDGNVRLQLDRQGTRVMTTGFFPGPVKVWNAQGKLVREFPGSNAAALSGDGKRIALGAGVNNTPKGPSPPSARVSEPGLEEHLVTFIQDEKGKQESGIKIVDVDSGALVKTIATPQRGIQWLALRPDEKMIATADGQTLSLWDVESGKEVHQLKGFGQAIFGLRFTSDGATLSVGGVPNDNKRIVHLIDVATGKRRHELDAHGNLTCDFSADGKTIAIAPAFGEMHLWDVATGKEIVRPAAEVSSFFALQGSADGRSLVLAGKDRTIRRWDVPGKTLGAPVKIDLSGLGKKSPPLEGLPKQAASRDDDDEDGPAERFFHGHFSADGSILRVTSTQPMKLVDASTGQVKQSIDAGQRGGQFSSDGAKLAAVGTYGVARLYDIASGRLLHTLKGPKNARSLSWTPNGQRLVVECNNNDGKAGFLIVFDAVSGAELRRLDWSPETSTPVAISADGKSFVAVRWGGSSDGARPQPSIMIWDLDNLKEKLTFAAPSFGTALFRPDGKALYTVGQDAILRVWDLDKGTEAASVPLGLQATGGSMSMCFVGPNRIACLNMMGTVTIVRLRPPVGDVPKKN